MNKLIGDYEGFFSLQKERLRALDIDIEKFPISHLAFRTESWNEYIKLRDQIEEHCVGNIENFWNGRPISKMLLKNPLILDDGHSVALIELIPPPHQRVYKMGLEHLGFVVGKGHVKFGQKFRNSLTGQQFQSGTCEPYYILFEDYTHVKFYRDSLLQVCEGEGHRFDEFKHV